MPYRCEKCGRSWNDQNAADNDFLCSRKCGGALKPVGYVGIAKSLVQSLPHPLAVVLQEYLGETNDYVKLHRLCDAAEMLTRFLASVALAEIAVVAGATGPPEALRNALLDGIELPTFGKWAAILRAALTALPSRDALLVPELEAMGNRVLQALGSNQDPIDEAILRLRNEVAHSRIGPEKVSELLAAHKSRFEALWQDECAVFLSELELLGIADGGSCLLLRGIPDPTGTFPTHDTNRLQPCNTSRLQWPAGTILLTRVGHDRFRVLFPLQAFGPVLHHVDERLEQVTVDPVAQVYARNDRIVQYTAFHPREGHGDGTEVMQAAFNALFPLKDWRDAIREDEEASIADVALRAAVREFSFRDLVESLLREPFVGRERQMTDALVWLDRHATGVGLILGQPGMGKTAFAARLLAEVKRLNKNWLCLRHFFKVDDDRCSTRKFIVGVLLQLQLAGGARIELPADDIEARGVFVNALETFSRDGLGEGKAHARMVLLLDGLDEIAQRDPRFFDIVRGRQIPNVTWLCSARPDSAVLEGLPESAVERLFPSAENAAQPGLPPLNRQAVRQYLVEELGRGRYKFLVEETDEGRSRFLDALTDDARSLPLYLRLLVEDMRRGDFDAKQPEKLPKDLDAYYDRVMDRLGLDAARKVLPDVMALLAVAYTPLTADMLANLLHDHDLRNDPEWHSIFTAALRLGHTLLKVGYLWEGTTGYTLYHNSFRAYLLRREESPYSEFRMAPVVRQARRRILEQCRRWQECVPDSDDRRYVLTYAPRHLTEAGDLTGVIEVVRGDFLQMKAAWSGNIYALADAQGIAEFLAGAGEEYWDDLVTCAFVYWKT